VVAFVLVRAAVAHAQEPDKAIAGPQAAPPLPFSYVGRLVQNGKTEVIVMRGGVLYSVAEGEEIEGEYRVERISGSNVAFTYLPARVKQNLDLTGAKR
jgi:hypothetical protein